LRRQIERFDTFLLRIEGGFKMKSLYFLIFFLVLTCSYAICDCTTPCQNATSTCPSGDLVKYYANPNAGSCGVSVTDSSYTCSDPQATCSEGVCVVILYGRLYIPTTHMPRGGYPGIILNHGSASDAPHFPGYYCGVIKFFVDKGYVVLLPYRYGYSLQPDGSQHSTGTYDNDPVNLQIDGVIDVDRAVQYLKSYAPVNPNKIAFIGHSYGGIVSIFANASNLGQQAVVSISGDSESWGNDALRDTLYYHIDNATSPMFFLQPKNDVDISPTAEFFRRAAGYPDNIRSEGAIYAPVSYAPTGECAHICFVYDDKFIKAWGNTVIDFLKRNGVN
jgi:dienelactone hydrolase